MNMIIYGNGNTIIYNYDNTLKQYLYNLVIV